jgi:ribosomal protein S18 acetylase RimI-like enzyme
MSAGETLGHFRFVGIGWLGRVLACYRECFDETQRLRTVAHSPLLFRLFYGWLLLRGRCRIAAEVSAGRVSGFCIVRDLGDGRWLLSGIGVSPSRRRRGSARKLFGMVADRHLVLSVESGGPVGFYEKMGMKRAGEKTVLYVDRASADALRSLPNFRSGRGSKRVKTPLNRSAFLVSADSLDDEVVSSARAEARWYRWVVVEFPGHVPAPEGRFRAAVHELVFERPAADAASPPA